MIKDEIEPPADIRRYGELATIIYRRGFIHALIHETESDIEEVRKAYVKWQWAHALFTVAMLICAIYEAALSVFILACCVISLAWFMGKCDF